VLPKNSSACGIRPPDAIRRKNALARCWPMVAVISVQARWHQYCVGKRVCGSGKQADEVALLVEQVFLKIPGDGTVGMPVLRFGCQPAVYRMHIMAYNCNFSGQWERNSIAQITKTAYIIGVAGFLLTEVVARKTHYG
jgi:hypothetical protein